MLNWAWLARESKPCILLTPCLKTVSLVLTRVSPGGAMVWGSIMLKAESKWKNLRSPLILTTDFHWSKLIKNWLLDTEFWYFLRPDELNATDISPRINRHRPREINTTKISAQYNSSYLRGRQGRCLTPNEITTTKISLGRLDSWASEINLVRYDGLDC